MMLPPDHDHRDDSHAERAEAASTVATWNALIDYSTQRAELYDQLGEIVVGILVHSAIAAFVLAPIIGALIGLIFGITLSYGLCVVVMLIVLILTAIVVKIVSTIVPSEADLQAGRIAAIHAEFDARREVLEAEFAARCEQNRLDADARAAESVDAIMREHHAKRILAARHGDPAALWALERAARIAREEREREADMGVEENDPSTPPDPDPS